MHENTCTCPHSNNRGAGGGVGTGQLLLVWSFVVSGVLTDRRRVHQGTAEHLSGHIKADPYCISSAAVVVPLCHTHTQTEHKVGTLGQV